MLSSVSVTKVKSEEKARQGEEGEEGDDGSSVVPVVPVKKGMGAYGCYYYPRVPCHDITAAEMRELDAIELLGSKVQRRSSSLDQEIQHILKLVLNVPQHHMYFVVPKRVCNLTELTDVQDCDKLTKRKGKGDEKEKGKGDEKGEADEKGDEKGEGDEKEKAEGDEKGEAEGDEKGKGIEGGGPKNAYEEELVEALRYDKNGMWVNMLMRNIDHGLSVGAYLRSITHVERWSSLLRLYKHLMEAVTLLVDEKVGLIHWDLHSDNIMVDARTGIPYMIDFGLSIDAHDASERATVARSFEVHPYHYRWPLETQFMMWAHRGSEGVDAMVDMLTSHMRFFDICSVGFKERYVAGAKAFYKEFTRAHGKSDLMWLGWHTWDGYAVAVLFLQYICSMYSSGFYVNNRMLRDLFKLLLENIHYDWRRRPTAKETLRRLREMIDRSYTPEEYLLSREYPTMSRETGCPDM